MAPSKQNAKKSSSQLTPTPLQSTSNEVELKLVLAELKKKKREMNAQIKTNNTLVETKTEYENEIKKVENEILKIAATNKQHNRAYNSWFNHKSAEYLHMEEEMENLKPELDVMCAKQSAQKEQGFVVLPSCAICVQQFGPEEERMPRVLKCGHTICYGCAKHIFATSVGDARYKCPFDRVEHEKKPEELAINFTILKMCS